MTNKTFREMLKDLNDMFPFELVQGDSGKRISPNTNIMLNAGAAWMVSQDGKSAHKVLSKIHTFNKIPKVFNAIDDVINNLSKLPISYGTEFGNGYLTAMTDILKAIEENSND